MRYDGLQRDYFDAHIRVDIAPSLVLFVRPAFKVAAWEWFLDRPNYAYSHAGGTAPALLDALRLGLAAGDREAERLSLHETWKKKEE